MILIFPQLLGLELFAALIVAHALCDFPLQGDYLAAAKNWNTPAGKGFWPVALFMHAAIHGGAVWALTGSLGLGLVEMWLHAWIDVGKTLGMYGMKTDQALHVGCKVAWVLVVTFLL